MKKRFKYRSKLQKALTELGVPDLTVLEVDTNKVTKKQFSVLVNPQKRVMKSILSMTLEEQRLNLAGLQVQVGIKNIQRIEDNKLLENS